MSMIMSIKRGVKQTIKLKEVTNRKLSFFLCYKKFVLIKKYWDTLILNLSRENLMLEVL